MKGHAPSKTSIFLLALFKKLFSLVLIGHIHFSFASNNLESKSCSKLLRSAVRSEEKQAGAGFLLSKNPARHISPEIARAEALAKKAGVESSHKPKNKVAAWLAIVEKTHRSDLDEKSLKVLKRHYFKKYVIDPKDIPDSHRERTKTLLSEQEKSLGAWIDYFLSSDTSMYPMWAKVWVFEEMAKLRSLDSGAESFSKRGKSTVSKFPSLDRAALGVLMDGLMKKVNGESLDELDPELGRLLDRGNFSKLYFWAISRKASNSVDLSETDGKWVKYERGSDASKLVESLNCKNTGWCTEGASIAASQLREGYFYVYYSKDLKGKATQPRLAIRFEGRSIAEIRGIAKDQNLDPEMAKTEILEKKMKTFGTVGEVFKEEIRDTKVLTLIEEKIKKGESLTLPEISFLYEIDGKIKSFGYQSDPRIEEIKSITPLSESLKRFSRKEQRDFAFSLFERPQVPEQVLRDKRAVSYLLVFMRDHEGIRGTLLNTFGEQDKEIAKLLLSSDELTEDAMEQVLYGIGRNLRISEIFEIKALIEGSEISKKVSDDLVNHLIQRTLNYPQLRDIMIRGLFSENLELEDFTKEVLEQLRRNPSTSNLFTEDLYQELLALQAKDSTGRSLKEVAKDWLESDRTDLSQKAQFVMGFVGSGKNQYQKYLDRLPPGEREEVLEIVGRETSLPTFEKFAKKRGLSEELFSEGLLESFTFKRENFPKYGEPKTFKMGDNLDIEVTLTRPFEMQATPVTQLQWALVMGQNPSLFTKSGKKLLLSGKEHFVDGNRPVEMVSWEDAQEFIKRLNESQDKYIYRLPTEAEWEFAARGGTETKFFFGDDESDIAQYGWSRQDSQNQTQSVGKLRANPFGLHDVHGNVWEWMSNWHTPSPSGGVDPRGPSSGSDRVLRGGGWSFGPVSLRSAKRICDDPSVGNYDIGLRLVRTLR